MYRSFNTLSTNKDSVSYDKFEARKSVKLWLIDDFKRVALLEFAFERGGIGREGMAAAAADVSVGSIRISLFAESDTERGKADLVSFTQLK